MWPPAPTGKRACRWCWLAESVARGSDCRSHPAQPILLPDPPSARWRLVVACRSTWNARRRARHEGSPVVLVLGTPATRIRNTTCDADRSAHVSLRGWSSWVPPGLVFVPLRGWFRGSIRGWFHPVPTPVAPAPLRVDPPGRGSGAARPPRAVLPPASAVPISPLDPRIAPANRPALISPSRRGSSRDSCPSGVGFRLATRVRAEFPAPPGLASGAARPARAVPPPALLVPISPADPRIAPANRPALISPGRAGGSSHRNRNGADLGPIHPGPSIRGPIHPGLISPGVAPG